MVTLHVSMRVFMLDLFVNFICTLHWKLFSHAHVFAYEFSLYSLVYSLALLYESSFLFQALSYFYEFQNVAIELLVTFGCFYACICAWFTGEIYLHLLHSNFVSCAWICLCISTQFLVLNSSSNKQRNPGFSLIFLLIITFLHKKTLKTKFHLDMTVNS